VILTCRYYANILLLPLVFVNSFKLIENWFFYLPRVPDIKWYQKSLSMCDGIWSKQIFCCRRHDFSLDDKPKRNNLHHCKTNIELHSSFRSQSKIPNLPDTTIIGMRRRPTKARASSPIGHVNINILSILTCKKTTYEVGRYWQNAYASWLYI